MTSYNQDVDDHAKWAEQRGQEIFDMEIKLKRRNPFSAAWYTYPRLRKLGFFSRWQCLKMALSHFWSPLSETDNSK